MQRVLPCKLLVFKRVNSINLPSLFSLSPNKTLRFYKSFNNLNIKIKEVSVTIKTNNNKILVDNKYFPFNINLINKESILNKVIKVLRNLSPCPYPVREGVENSNLIRIVKPHPPLR